MTTTGTQRALRTTILVLLGGLISAACSVPSPCDPGQTHDHGVCIDPPPPLPGGDGDGDGDDDAGSEDASEPDAAMEPPATPFICPAGGDTSAYGRDCDSHDDCECPASLCITSLGYCTGTQCMEPGKECPEDMTCLDIAPFREGASFEVPDEVTHICL